MRIYVVTHGQYSDRHVVAVTDDESVASRVERLGDSGSIQTFELNVIADRLVEGYRRWAVTFLAEGDGSVLEAREDFSPCDLYPSEPYETSYPNRPSLSRAVVEFYVDARDKAEAVKIAADKRREWLATVKA